MKQQLTALCIPALRLFFRHSPLGRLNVLVWKKLCKRFINWRAIEIEIEAPQRLEHPPRTQADIVFSRRDAATL